MDIEEGARDAWEEAQRQFFDPASKARQAGRGQPTPSHSDALHRRKNTPHSTPHNTDSTTTTTAHPTSQTPHITHHSTGCMPQHTPDDTVRTHIGKTDAHPTHHSTGRNNTKLVHVSHSHIAFC